MSRIENGRKTGLPRRDFLKAAGGASLGFAALLGNFPAPAFAQTRNPNEKLKIAFIGLAGMQGEFHLGSAGNENVVALCDVDDNPLGKVGERFPSAKKYNDFRVMFDELDGKIEAVVISTPDHTHAIAGMNALRRGIHIYVEKPLAHTVEEVRKMTDLAREKKLYTQAGTQIHAGSNYRRVVELIKSGAIGKVKEVHTWCGTFWGGKKFPTEFPEVPKNLHWDLWLGPVAHRPYAREYFGGNWRSFWAFGNGSLGDMGSHHIDLPFWALDLKYPTSIESKAPTAPDPEMTPIDMVASYEFPARKDLPPVTLTWYDGNARPKQLQELDPPQNWGAGNLFIGSEGMLLADYGRYMLFPQNKFAEFKAPPKTIPESIGHHAEWIHAIKNASAPSLCDFSYAGPLAETVLLGTVAYKLGKKITWDGPNMKATNAPEAEKLVKKQYPKDWGIE